MSNATLVRESFEAFDAGDTERVLAAASPGLVLHMAGMPEPLRGRDAWLEGFRLMKSAFPDLEATIDDLVAEGDEVAARLTLRGTHAGEFQGLPATGRRIEYVSHEFYRVQDGVIVEEWVCSDMASLFGQLS